MNDMGYVLAAILASIMLLRRGLLKLARREVAWHTDPVMLLMGAWVIQSIAYALPVFENRDHLEGRHVLFIVTCHLAFLAGVLVVPSGIKKKHGLVQEAQPLPVSLPILIGVGVLGLLGNFFVAYNALSMSSIGLWDRLTGDMLEEIRLEVVSATRGGKFASLEFLASATTVYVCLMTAGITRELKIKPIYIRLLIAGAVASVLFVTLNALAIKGGRMGMILLFMGAALGALMDPRRTLLGYFDRVLGRAKVFVLALSAVVALGGLWYFATTFVEKRSSDTTSPMVALYQYHRASPTPLVADLVGDRRDLQYGLLSFSYLTVPLTTLSYYYDMPHGQFPGPYWGQYNFTGPVTFLMRRMGLVKYQESIGSIRTEATRYLRVMGYGDNVWPTLLRDIAFDVGWAGVPLVMFILGWAAEMIMRSARQDGNFIAKVLGLLMAVFLVFSIAHSLMVVESFQKAFGFCFAILIYQRIFKRKPKKVRAEAMQAA